MAKTIEICPVCKKATVTLYMGGYLGKIYRCSQCEYVGPVILEMDAEEYARMVSDIQ